jgi:hypothetical protein
MEAVSKDLTEALADLRRAAESAFFGNAYYRVANDIDALADLAGPHAPLATASESGRASDFPSALAKVRALSQAHLSGARYHFALQKLDELSFLASEASAAFASTRPARGPSFDDLAAASKARVEAVAASLGLTPPGAAPAAKIEPETRADGELERRSSEPCLAAEFEERRLGQVDTVFVSEGDSGRAPVQAPQAARSQAVDLERNAGASERAEGAPSEAGSKTFAQTSSPAHDPSPPASGQAVSHKSFFVRWLDIVFGGRC